MFGNTNTDFWGSMRDVFKGIFESDGFGEIGREVVPGLAGGLAAGGVNALFGGGRDKYKGLDTRTASGQNAENIRLGAAGGAGKEYAMALRGELDPRAEYNIGKRVRSASAASGGLETGGHGEREVNAKQDELNRIKNQGAQNVSSLTGGFQSLQPTYFYGGENPWAMALTGAAGRGVRRGGERAWDRWVTNRKRPDSYDDTSKHMPNSFDYDRYWD